MLCIYSSKVHTHNSEHTRRGHTPRALRRPGGSWGSVVVLRVERCTFTPPTYNPCQPETSYFLLELCRIFEYVLHFLHSFIHPFMIFEYVLAQIPDYSSNHSLYLSMSFLRYQIIHSFIHPSIHDIWVCPCSDTRLFIHPFIIFEYVLSQIPDYSSIHSWYLSMSLLRYQIIHPSIHYIWVCPFLDTRLFIHSFIHPFMLFEYVLAQIPAYSSIHSWYLSMSFLRYQIIHPFIHPSIHAIWVCPCSDTRLFIHSFMIFEYV